MGRSLQRLIVTRPRAQAAAWVKSLDELGIDAQALPLIGIGALPDPAPLRAAWQTLAQRALAVFVSPNAVQHFFAQRPAGLEWPAGVPAASPGPGTTAALRAQGLPEALLVEPAPDALSFDSEALWAQLCSRPWQGTRVLVVRGADGRDAGEPGDVGPAEHADAAADAPDPASAPATAPNTTNTTNAGHGRDWLAAQLRGQGAEVEYLAAYCRQAPMPTPAEGALLEQALRRPGEHVWLFSSSEAIAALHQLAPGADWSAARALASHPRIAERARAAGFGAVGEVAPSPAAVAAALGRTAGTAS
jgi:uroporphyrinogen-III synthase